MKDADSQGKDVRDTFTRPETVTSTPNTQNPTYKPAWREKTSPYIPLITVLVAVAGFLFGVYQFQAQQKLFQDRMIAEQEKDRAAKEREQSIRIQSQIRSDVDELLQFTSRREMTISRVVFLLNDLKALVRYAPDGGENAAESHSTREK